MQRRILIAEDNLEISDTMRNYLIRAGYVVSQAFDGGDAIEQARRLSPDLILLDIMMPVADGYEVCESIRRDMNIPIIVVSAKVAEEDKIRLFELGADDYVVKPFRIRELLARVKRTLDIHRGSNSEMLEIDRVKIDVGAGKVFADGRQVELTALEYRLLLIFANNKGILLTRNQILEKIWDVDGNFVEDNTLTVYVKRLREKLGDAMHVETVRGIGYRVG